MKALTKFNDEVDFCQWTGENQEEMSRFLIGDIYYITETDFGHVLRIADTIGLGYVYPSDYVIKDAYGNTYLRKKEVFKRDYTIIG